jgi:ATP-dependent helicase/nuclease subunit A
VLDYKLSHTPERLAEHREQLLRYRRVVESLRPGDTVRCAFVTGEGAVIEVEGSAPTGESPHQLALFEPG